MELIVREYEASMTKKSIRTMIENDNVGFPYCRYYRIWMNYFEIIAYEKQLFNA
jgi:hypothetical protein